MDPERMGGAPCIRGLRIPVATVAGMVADGMSTEEILRALPDLEAADVEAALRYADDVERVREDEDFTSRARALLERDKGLLDRLAD